MGGLLSVAGVSFKNRQRSPARQDSNPANQREERPAHNEWMDVHQLNRRYLSAFVSSLMVRKPQTFDMDEQAVWMDEDERDRFELQSESQRDRLIVQLGTLCGLRVGEWRTLKVKDVFERDIENESMYWLNVGREIAKTTEADREVWLPSKVHQNILMLIKTNELNQEDYIIQSRNGGGLSDSGARHVVKQLAQRLYNETGDPRHKHISSHDMRRFHANRLVERGIDTNILLDQLGWSSFQSALPYLSRATRSNVAQSLTSLGFE